MSSALGAWSLSHSTTREVPHSASLKEIVTQKETQRCENKFMLARGKHWLTCGRAWEEDGTTTEGNKNSAINFDKFEGGVWARMSI